MNNNLKELFVKTIKKGIQREGVDELLEYLENSDFYTAPASSIYHGSYEGGLLEHSLNVLNCLRYEYDCALGAGLNLPEIPEESIIICALLHDLCKVNCYVESSRNVKNEQTGQWEKVACYKREPLFCMGHGGKSVFIIQQFIKLKPFEAQAIFWHMGAYDTSNYMTLNELGKAYEENLLAFLLNAADMKATYLSENKNYT